ncbi:hypothetical protein PMIN04_004207 [Paraphaeosphaeria minitans]
MQAQHRRRTSISGTQRSPANLVAGPRELFPTSVRKEQQYLGQARQEASYVPLVGAAYFAVHRLVQGDYLLRETLLFCQYGRQASSSNDKLGWLLRLSSIVDPQSNALSPHSILLCGRHGHN